MNETAFDSAASAQADAVDSSDLSSLVITLLKGVIYQDADSEKWSRLLELQSRVRDYVSVLGLELVLDEAEGYTFLRSKPVQETPESGRSTGSPKAPPRLIARRKLSFPVSLLLALLRKKLAEFDAHGGDTRLVLSREDIVELIRVFLPTSSNEARIADQVDAHINKIIELGFLRRLKPGGSPGAHSFEVRRILKAFVDAQWLADFDERLEFYRRQAMGTHVPRSKEDDDADE